MTYILTDDELNTLVGFFGILPESISPYKIIPEARTSQSLDSLRKCGLLGDLHKDACLTEDGRVVAELLAAPEICVRFEKKTDGTTVSVFADSHSNPTVWCVCLRTSDPAVNVLKLFPSKESVVTFLKKEVFRLKTEFNEEFDVDYSLTYGEWLIFCLSQMCYMRKQSGGEEFFTSENEYLTDDEIYSEKFFSFLSKNTEVDPSDFASADKRNAIYSSLCAKGIFVKNPENEAYKYSDNAKIWLDNDVAYDSIKVAYDNVDGASYTLVLTLRINGVTSMHDTGNGVRIISSRTVPFSAYLS